MVSKIFRELNNHIWSLIEEKTYEGSSHSFFPGFNYETHIHKLYYA
jgi:hypothetical protein